MKFRFTNKDQDLEVTKPGKGNQHIVQRKDEKGDIKYELVVNADTGQALDIAISLGDFKL